MSAQNGVRLLAAHMTAPCAGRLPPEASASRRGGLTLVEVVVAMLLFGICIGGACKLALIAREMSDRARSHYIAANIGKNRVERAQTFEFNELELMEETGTVVDWNGLPVSGGEFRRSTAVNVIDEDLKEMVVTTEIRDRMSLGFGGVSEQVRTYFTYMGRIPE